MVDTDSAFLWETEALRSVAHSPLPAPRRVKPVEADVDWLTLREANEITGIPVPTLRKWARRDNVPSHLEDTAMGQLRMVSLQGVYQRAEELGREVRTPPVQRPRAAGTANTPTVLDLTSGEPVATHDKAEPEAQERTMLVPLDAWNKMLNQLGNLHEAGQQLAEARERAAKAETEATFLKERLAEVRADLAEARSTEPRETGAVGEQGTRIPVQDGDEEGAEASGDVAGDHPTFTEYSMEMVKHLFSTWKGRPRRRRDP